MNFVDSLDMFGVPAKEIPCIRGSGAPSATTAGAVGSLYMDTKTGDLYKCTAALDGAHTWVAAVPTDEHINGLIDAALGAIENGTY